MIFIFIVRFWSFTESGLLLTVCSCFLAAAFCYDASMDMASNKDIL
jgi:hypothetical protein